jgi:hypothetical protein
MYIRYYINIDTITIESINMDQEYNPAELPPFSGAFVMKTTFRHMRRSVDISIRKSFERFKDFEKNSEMGTEIMATLSNLHTVRKWMDDFQEANKHLFTDKK